ncbi:MAG: hypothetical protein H8E40_06675 [Chloroflexi bacterium]|nr:hypothetical protein [Chloroflexota bacterium]
MYSKDKPKGFPVVAREKIDSFTEEDWKISEKKMSNTESSIKFVVRQQIFELALDPVDNKLRAHVRTEWSCVRS